jgi:DNA polymerase-3 subunit gamma/tau
MAGENGRVEIFFMAYLVLARKYRPQTFDEVIGQGHVTQTLTNAITAGRVAHAILFAGPRGTGKTTVARILAKAMNCAKGPLPAPCNACPSCREITGGNAVDVFEIDGASNNSVDQVRELRENVKYMPAHSAYKIYIIDEVHMLSIAAFNALLKTLEEPPAHVMFFFATTEPHKIPITILSRCQRYDLRRINIESITGHLASLCDREQITIPVESLELIAREAGGSMRDAMSLLDQVMSCTQGAIQPEKIVDILGVIDRTVIFDLSAAVLSRDLPKVLDILDDVYEHGHDLKRLYADVTEHFRNLLVVKWGRRVEKLVDLPAHEIELMATQVKDTSGTYLNQIFDLLFEAEASIRFAPQPKLALEMIFMRMLLLKPALPIDMLIEKLDHLKREFGTLPARELSEAQTGYGSDGSVAVPLAVRENVGTTDIAPEIAQRSVGSEAVADVESIPPAAPVAQVVSKFDAGDDNETLWGKIIDAVARKKPSVASNMAKCRLKGVKDNTLEIEVSGNGFITKMVTKNIPAVKQACSHFFGRDMQVELCRKADVPGSGQKKPQENRQQEQDALSHPLVSDAIEIFNGTLVDVKKL